MKVENVSKVSKSKVQEKRTDVMRSTEFGLNFAQADVA